MDTSEKFVLTGFILFVLAILGMFFFALVGLHINTGHGAHVGFVTSTETTGLIFKTNRAYIKTDTQSSQEDAYCVAEDSVLADLKAHSDTHDRVEVTYIKWLSSGIASCGGEDEVITKVSAVK